MAEISKIKLANGTTVALKDAGGRELINAATVSLASEIARAKAAEATLTANLAAEVTRATGAESGLSSRIEALEARGRFLSGYAVATGLPTTYPEIPAGASYPYVYAFKSGDYYIVDSVPASGTKYMPNGANITKNSAAEDWVVGKVETALEISVGDYFLYDGTKWVHVSNAQKTVSFINIAGNATDNVSLKGELDKLVPQSRQVAGLTLTADIAVADLQEAIGLEDLAYADKAEGSYTPAGSVSVSSDAIKGGTITLNDLNQTATAATLTKADYTPSGSINGSAIAGGTINVSVKDAAAASEASITYGSYTPAGSISGATFTALKSATFQKSDAGVAIEGTVSAPSINLTAAEKTVVTGLKGGAVASFVEGAFTAASLGDGFYTAGSAASWTGATYSAHSLGAASTATMVSDGIVAAIDETDTEMLVFSAAPTLTAVTAQGSFSAGSVNFGTFDGGSATQIDVSKFNGGSKAADTFTPNVLQDVNTATVNNVSAAALAEAPAFTGAKYNLNTDSDTAMKNATFAGTAADIKPTKVEYVKQVIDAKEFIPSAASLTFVGAESKSILVTAVNYDKASANGASFNPQAASVTASFTGTAATIVVEPVANA